MLTCSDMVRLFLALLGCGSPSPDALFQAHDYAGAEAAWARASGEPVHLDETVSDLLLLRNPKLTVAEAAPAVAAWRLLEDAPVRSRMAVEQPFARVDALIAAAQEVASRPLDLVVGRSEGRGDGDIYVDGTPLPFSGGRMHGWQTWLSRPALGAKGAGTGADLSARLEANPPSRLLTLALRDPTGSLWLWAEHTPDGWMLKAASSFPATDRVLRVLNGVGGVKAHAGLRPEGPAP